MAKARTNQKHVVRLGRPIGTENAQIRDEQVMAIIKEFWAKEYRPPTYLELGGKIGMTQAAVFKIIKRMKQNGALHKKKAIVPMSILIQFDDRIILKRFGLV
jgi:hypothetical protein